MEAMKSNEYSLSAARVYAAKKFGCESCSYLGRCYQHGGEECNLCEGGGLLYGRVYGWRRMDEAANERIIKTKYLVDMTNVALKFYKY